ncbi:hypothetical protein M514_05938 [Trichuris suis]|uniref:ShKT domain-containing protein n=1 Tax=Trichuris suis TaxID=68888 RepID=A0A085N7W7_9BILA
MDVHWLFTCLLLSMLFVATTFAGFDKNEAIQHCEQVMCEEHYLEMTEICNGNREECPETWNSYMACMKPCINRELESESDEHRLYSSIIRRIEYSMDVETVQKL